jgi:hypothetical protein
MNGHILSDFDMTFVRKFISWLENEKSVNLQYLAQFKEDIRRLDWASTLKEKKLWAAIDDMTNTCNVTYMRQCLPMSNGLTLIGFSHDEGSNYLSWTIGITDEKGTEYLQTELTALTEKMKWELVLI